MSAKQNKPFDEIQFIVLIVSECNRCLSGAKTIPSKEPSLCLDNNQIRAAHSLFGQFVNSSYLDEETDEWESDSSHNVPSFCCDQVLSFRCLSFGPVCVSVEWTVHPSTQGEGEERNHYMLTWDTRELVAERGGRSQVWQLNDMASTLLNEQMFPLLSV